MCGTLSSKLYAKFCSHLKLTSIPWPIRNINAVVDKTGIFVYSDIDHPFCPNAPLSLVSNDIGAIEVVNTIVVVITNSVKQAKMVNRTRRMF